MTAEHVDLELRQRVAERMGWKRHQDRPWVWVSPVMWLEVTDLPAFELDRWPDVLGWLTEKGYWWRMDGCGEETWFEVLIPDDRRILWEASGSTPGLAVCQCVAQLETC